MFERELTIKSAYIREFEFQRTLELLPLLELQSLITDRFVALPGDALACKMGELKFLALLAHAQQALGARFDIRDFHSEILKDGAMPLDILEAKMKPWIEARR